jgi:hypothetical protein
MAFDWNVDLMGPMWDDPVLVPFHVERGRTIYAQQAVIAAEPLLSSVAHTVEGARVVPLPQAFALLPMTDAFYDAVACGASEAADDRPDGFWKLPPGFDRTLAAWSEGGPVAYVEAEYCGGTGQQTAQVWHGGVVVLGPVHIAAGVPFPAAGSPISQALRRLGVARGRHADEFEAVALRRRRDTEDWLGRSRHQGPTTDR